jgi:hypothetical protein
MIASMINISSLKYDTTLNYESSVLSIIILVFLSISIALETYVIYIYHDRYELSDFKLRYGTCTKGLNTDTLAGRYWNPLTLTRWAATNLIMIFLRDHCVAQIFVLLLISGIFQVILIYEKPMAEKCDQWMAVGIEASVSIYLYCLLSLTNFSGENTLRIELGWVLAMLTGIVIGINVLLFLWKITCRALMFVKLLLPRFFIK